ncbi:MAG: deoxyribonuclease V [Verrucomicrobia bacterium]|nr:deoxyribonuclease V [Verrucomicrobiota bacterium]
MGKTIPRWPHPSRPSYQAAVAIQQRLAGRVIAATGGERIRYVAGLDAAFLEEGSRCVAAAVLWDMRRGVVCEETVAERRAGMPYIPGLLSFREGPALLAALRGLGRAPDALLCDGHGIAHMRRFGVACHLGVLCDLPAVGCAKSRLIGTHQMPGVARGEWAPLRSGNELLGCVVRTRDGIRPVYVSIGHRISLARARWLVLRCSGRFRLPEPTRLADILVAAAKRERRAHP